MSLDRFREAQDSTDSGFDTALAELERGRKRSHWIWYVFPQLAGLGRSSMAQFYALKDLTEACDYLREPVLRARLLAAAAAVQAQLAAGVRLRDLMGGSIDSLKLVSSLTLFRRAAHELTATVPELGAFEIQCNEILATAEAQGFPPCAHTLAQARLEM